MLNYFRSPTARYSSQAFASLGLALLVFTSHLTAVWATYASAVAAVDMEPARNQLSLYRRTPERTAWQPNGAKG
jgi:hypothetical protein